MYSVYLAVRAGKIVAMKGWVYIITNKALPNLIKVGYTMKDPELRAAELNHTGSPHPYVVDYEVLVEEPRDIEQTVHSRLRDKREGKEWFRCSSEEAIVAIKSVVGEKVHIESFKRADRAKAEYIRQREEAVERAKRAADEEYQKQEAALVAKRQEIISRYEPSLTSALSVTNFWVYFAGVFVALMIAFSTFFLEMEDAGLLMLSLIGAFIITPFIKGHFEERAKKSARYKSILAKKEAELAAVGNAIQKPMYKTIDEPVTYTSVCQNCGQKNLLTLQSARGSYKCGTCGYPINNPWR